MKKGCFGVFIVLLLVAGAGYYFWWSRNNPKLTWYTEPVDRGSVQITISASGSLAALTTVEVGTQISGIVASMSVDFNDRVYAGQLVAQIDASTYEATRQQNLAAVASAKASIKDVEAKLENIRASLQSTKAEQLVQKANVRKAEVALADAERDLVRMTDLRARNLIAQSDLDKAKTTRDSAQAAIEAAQAQVASVLAKEQSVLAQIRSNKAEMEGAQARLVQSEANLQAAEINLERTNIYSPIDGVVISREVDVGQTVAASLQAPKLFTIAQDLGQMQIDTAVDEADIGQVQEGQKVSFTVDAYKNRNFSGTVHQIRLLPITTSSVVTYSVMVNVQNPDLLLKPGMTANVEILVNEKNDVLRVPAAAFFFKPPQPYLALLDQLEKSINEKKSEGHYPPATGQRQGLAGASAAPVTATGTIADRADRGDRGDKGSRGGEGGRDDRGNRGDRRGRDGEGGGNQGSRGRSEIGTLWVLENSRPKPLRVRMGVSNQDFTEIVGNDLAVGQEVIIGQGTGDQPGGRRGNARTMRSVQSTMRRM